MEVHAHPHTPRKKWTHYLWEFLMLFLAVFCGFLAENQREHMVEHQREKVYIKSLAEDLKQDTSKLNQIIIAFNEKIVYKDSLLKELASPAVYKNSSKAYFFFEKSRHFPDFIYTDRTIQQLKNSGNMRLIRNKPVSDSIIEYDSWVRNLFIGQNQLNSLVLTYGVQKNKLFQLRLLETVSNNPSMSVPLLSQNRNDVDEFYNSMWDQKKFFAWVRDLDVDLLERGTRLIKLIEEEYHLK